VERYSNVIFSAIIKVETLPNICRNRCFK